MAQKRSMILALQKWPDDPTLHDADWRDFVLACEQNSELSSRDWKRYRLGIRHLRVAFRGRVPMEQMERELAVDAFVCACWYQPNTRVVRAALRALLTHRLGPRVYVSAAAEYWKWAKAYSTSDLSTAESMIAQARLTMRSLNSWEQNSLERMLKRVVGGQR